MNKYQMPAFLLAADKIRDLSPEVLDDTGRLKIMPAEYWARTTMDERALFGHRHALYSFPTVELVEHLRGIIDGRRAIEIGAGSGVLAEALGIPATDSHQQTMPKYREIYRQAGQPIITYGPNVQPYDAKQAVKKYRPQVVIAAWVTEKYNKHRPWAGGNEEGIDEGALLDAVDTYVLIGVEKTHGDKIIWNRPHTIEYPDFVYSRSHSGTRDFVARWDKPC